MDLMDFQLLTRTKCVLVWAVSRDMYNTRQGLRSFPDLTEHLTARADDNHAAPAKHPRRPPHFCGMQLSFKPW